MIKNGTKLFPAALILCVAVVLIIFSLRVCGVNILGSSGEQMLSCDNVLNLCSLDLNAATWKELDDIPGVGTALAKAIVDYRDAYGKYVDMDELLYIRGMSMELYQSITQYVFLGGTS